MDPINTTPQPPPVKTPIPKSFGELLLKDGENTAEAVDFVDATRAVTRHIRDGIIGTQGDEKDVKILAAPIEVRVPGSDEVLRFNDHVFPDQPDLRYIKFQIPAVSMLFLGTAVEEYFAGKTKYKIFDEKTRTFKFRKISKTYIRQVQLTGWWRSPQERDQMTGQLAALFQIAQNTGRLLTPKGSHVFMTYLGDRNINSEDNSEDRIYQNVSTWELRVRGFTDEEYGRTTGITVSATPQV